MNSPTTTNITVGTTETEKVRNLRFASPKERLTYFLRTVEPKTDALVAVNEVLHHAVDEFKDLVGRLVESKTTQAAATNADFLKAVIQQEVDGFDRLSVADAVALASAFGLGEAKQQLATQFFVDGFDVWLNHQDIHRVKTMLIACGVQPSLVNQAAEESRDRLNDFLITLIFPEKDDRTEHGDWLASLKAKNEAFAVEEYRTTPPPASPAPPGEGAELVRFPTAAEIKNDRKRPRDDEEDVGDSTDSKSNVTGKTTAEDGELLITEETLPKLMETQPNLIPKDILRAHRRKIGTGINEFALTHHYTMDELRKWATENSVQCGRRTKVELARGILQHLADKK